MCFMEPARHIFRHSPEDSPGYFGRLKIIQNLSFITGGCLMVRNWAASRSPRMSPTNTPSKIPSLRNFELTALDLLSYRANNGSEKGRRDHGRVSARPKAERRRDRQNRGLPQIADRPPTGGRAADLPPNALPAP